MTRRVRPTRRRGVVQLCTFRGHSLARSKRPLRGRSPMRLRAASALVAVALATVFALSPTDSRAAPITYEFSGDVTGVSNMSYFAAYTGLDYGSLAVDDVVSGTIAVDWDLLPGSIDPATTTVVNIEDPSIPWLVVSLEDGSGNTWSPFPEDGESFVDPDQVAVSDTTPDRSTLWNDDNSVAFEILRLWFEEEFASVEAMFDNLESLTDSTVQDSVAEVCDDFRCSGETGSFTFEVTGVRRAPGSVPEPGTLFLLVLGLGTLAIVARRRSA